MDHQLIHTSTLLTSINGVALIHESYLTSKFIESQIEGVSNVNLNEINLSLKIPKSIANINYSQLQPPMNVDFTNKMVICKGGNIYKLFKDEESDKTEPIAVAKITPNFLGLFRKIVIKGENISEITVKYNFGCNKFKIAMGDTKLCIVLINKSRSIPTVINISAYNPRLNTFTLYCPAEIPRINPALSPIRRFLHFDNNRITQASVKNFMIKNPDNRGQTILQFGRIKSNRNVFIMDSANILAPEIAFAISLCLIIH